MKHYILIISLAFLCFSSYSAVELDSKGCKPGKFTTDLAAAKKVAKANNRFIVGIQGRNDGLCSACNNACNATYGTSGFLSWSKSNGIPLVYGDYASNAGGCYTWVKGFTNQSGWPQAAVTEKDGTTLIDWFSPSAGAILKFANNSEKVGKGGIDGFKDTIQAVIDSSNNTVAKARKITSSKEPFEWGLYYDYGLSTLRAFYDSSCRYTDPVDWYQVMAKDLEKGYVLFLQAQRVTDAKNYAKVRVFGSKEDASKGTNDLVAEMSLTDFAEKGIRLASVTNGSVYVKIYRADNMGKKTKVDIKYALLVQQISAEPPTTFAFTGEPTRTWAETNGVKTLTVTRNGTATNATFKVCNLSNAVEGVDFDILDAAGAPTQSRIIRFSGNTATLKLRINSDGGLWKGDRRLTLALESDEEPAEGSRTVDVLITEVHAQKDKTDPADDVKSGATSVDVSSGSAAVSARLNVDDLVDWYKLDVDKDSMVIVTLEPKALYNTESLKLDIQNAAMDISKSTNTFGKASLKFSPAESGELAFGVSREAGAADVTVSALYDLKISIDRNWVKPSIAFTGASAETDDTVASYDIVLTRSGSTTDEDTVFVTVTGLKDTDAEAIAGVPVTFAKGATTAKVQLKPNVADNRGVWKGDRVATVAFRLADTEFCSVGEPGTQTLTLKETDLKYENEADKPGVESAVAPAFQDAPDGKPIARTLNGDDVEDFFTFTGIEGDKVYQFTTSLDTNTLRNVQAADVKVDIQVPGKDSVTVSLTKLDGGKYKALGDGEIKVRVHRPAATAGQTASLAYSLGLKEWFPPVFSFEKVNLGEVDDTNGCFAVKVLRSVNLVERNTVYLTLSNVTVLAAGDFDHRPETDVPVTFEKDESEKTVEIAFTSETNGIYTCNRDYAIGLDFGASEELMRRGEPDETRVTLRDVDKEFDARDPADDVFGGRTKCLDLAPLSKKSARKTEASRLNGGDLADWYAFTADSEHNLCVGAVVESTAMRNLDLTDVKVTFYLYDSIAREPVEIEGGTVDFEELSNQEWVYRTDMETFVYAKVWRESQQPVASFEYQLTYRLQPPREVMFVADQQVVASERATAAYADVCLVIDGGDPLDEEVHVFVKPEVDESVDETQRAQPGEDFDPSPVEVVWGIGSTGGVKRVAIPLTNHTDGWEGDEYFKAVLSSEDAEVGKDGANEIRVTVVDDEAKPAGAVGIVGLVIGSETNVPSASRTYGVNGDGKVALILERTGGMAGAVEGVFTWKDKSGKTAKTVGEPFSAPLYRGESAKEDPIAVVELSVPNDGAIRLSRALTLEFAPKGEGVKKGALTALKFAISPADYRGAVASYAAGDRTKVDFAAADADWYAVAGGVAAFTPAAGNETVLRTDLTGPGTLEFKAELVNLGKCTVSLKTAGRVVAVTNGVNAVHIGNGRQMVEIVLTRPKAEANSAATVRIADVCFTPDATFNGYGTFNGSVSISLDDDKPIMPGLATMTVSSNGKVSGKFQCPDRTWTFKSDTSWDDSGLLTVVAQSGTNRLDLVLTNALETGWVGINVDNEGDGRVIGEMHRSPWSDRPLSPEAAFILDGDETREGCAGYYTMSLVDQSGEGSLGSGYLTMTVTEDGKMRASGQLADGLAVSFAGELIPDPHWDGAYVRLYATPSAYYGGWLIQGVSLLPYEVEGEPRKRIGLVRGNYEGYPNMPSWQAFRPTGESAFGARSLAVSGGKYDREENLAEYYEGISLGLAVDEPMGIQIGGSGATVASYAGDADHEIDLRFNAGGTAMQASVADPAKQVIASPFTISFNRATGVFSGSVRVRYAYGSADSPRYTVKSGTCRGVLTPWRNPKLIWSSEHQDDDFGEGRGYYLIDGVSRAMEIRCK